MWSILPNAEAVRKAGKKARKKPIVRTPAR